MTSMVDGPGKATAKMDGGRTVADSSLKLLLRKLGEFLTWSRFGCKLTAPVAPVSRQNCSTLWPH
jgi:hypothetical protein